jgi:hypothetical protein
MPSNRTTIPRLQRTRFTPEILELFARLEAIPPRRRDATDLKRLHRLLGLTREFWGGNSVLDRDKVPPWPDHMIGHHDWFRVHAVRLDLLEACGLADTSTRREPPGKHPARVMQ